MELKKIWFPLVVAAIWVLISAVTLSGFAGFSGTTRAAHNAELAQRRAAHSHVEGRRAPATAEHI
jgi:hypothetical protein